MKEQFRHIGRETHRILGSDIVTGKAMYVADNKVPGMKYGKILRSPYPLPASSAWIKAKHWPWTALPAW